MLGGGLIAAAMCSGISGGGGGDEYDIHMVNGSPSSMTVRTVSERGSESQSISTHSFSFSTKNFYKTTTITGKNKVITKIWTTTIIVAIGGSDGIVFTMDADDRGKLTACLDRNGNNVLNGETFGDSVFTTTPEGIALGWALAYCNEQYNETEKKIKAYEDGRQDNIDAGGDDETTIDEKEFEGSYARSQEEQNYPYSYTQRECFDDAYLTVSYTTSGNMVISLHGIKYDITYNNREHTSVRYEHYYDYPGITLSFTFPSDYASYTFFGNIYDSDGNLLATSLVVPVGTEPSFN